MNDKPEIAPLGDLPEHQPTEDSPLDDLAAYALLKQNGIIASDKKNGEDLWLMGQALEWANQKTPYGEWEEWFQSQGLKKTYVWQARKLHEKATLDEVKELGMTEALRKFAVVPDKKPQVAAPAAGGEKSKKANTGKAAPINQKESEEPTEAPESNDEDDGGDQDEANEPPSDDLADEEEKELKAYQQSIRKLTPKTRAVAILHALEALLDDLMGNEGEEYEGLANTFDQIIELAEAAKQIDHDEQNP